MRTGERRIKLITIPAQLLRSHSSFIGASALCKPGTQQARSFGHFGRSLIRPRLVQSGSEYRRSTGTAAVYCDASPTSHHAATTTSSSRSTRNCSVYHVLGLFGTPRNHSRRLDSCPKGPALSVSDDSRVRIEETNQNYPRKTQRFQGLGSHGSLWSFHSWQISFRRESVCQSQADFLSGG